MLFQARASDVKMPELRQHYSNWGMPSFINVCGTFLVPGEECAKNSGVHAMCVAEIISNDTNGEIQLPAILILRNISQVGLVSYKYDWHNLRSSRKLILSMPPPIACVHIAVDSTDLIVRKGHQFKIEVHLKWEMCQNELDTFENIPVV
jgi:hypothetical protein